MQTRLDIDSHFRNLLTAISYERQYELECYSGSAHSDKSSREIAKQELRDLYARSSGYTMEGDYFVTLSFNSGNQMPVFGFEPGDGVSASVVSSGKKISVSATVYDKSEDWIDLTLNKGSRDVLMKAESISIEPSVNMITFERMKTAVEFMRDTQNDRLIRMRDACYDLTDAYKHDEYSVDLNNDRLNTEQREAVIQLSQASPVGVLHGPPGTGKTTVLCEIALQSVKRHQSVYMTAPSNAACDLLVRSMLKHRVKVLRIGNPARVCEEERKCSFKRKCLDHSHSGHLQEVEDEIKLLKKKIGNKGFDRDLADRIRDLKSERERIRKQIIQSVLNEVQVFVGTPSGLYDPVIREKIFDLIILDEATQALEPLAWMAMSRSKRAVLAGDPMQLPGVVMSQDAEKLGLSVSLFERILKGQHHLVRCRLNRQYRMNSRIMQFVSENFYGGALVADESVADRTIFNENSGNPEDPPFEFIDTAGAGFAEAADETLLSLYNRGEADIVHKIVSQYLVSGLSPEEITVIAPYRAQVRILKDMLQDKAVAVGTVDAFQGQENKMVIISCVRSNADTVVGFLKDKRRLNVALSRAAFKLILVGDSSTLCALPVLKKAIDYAEATGGYRSIWETDWVEY